MSQIYEDLQNDSSHILPCYNLIQKRKKAKLDAQDDVLRGATRLQCTTIKGLTDELKIQWLSEHSDVSSKNFVKMMGVDKGVLDLLLQLALQMNLSARLPDKMQYWETLVTFMNARDDHCGGRLKHIRRNNGIKDDWNVDLAVAGPYVLKFTDQLLSELVHCSGDKVPVSADHHITKKHTLQDNVLDMSATLQLDPLPPIPLHSYFQKQKLGPHKVVHFAGKPKELEAKFDESYVNWERRARAAMSTEKRDEDLARDLDDHYKKLQQSPMKKAQEMAKKAVEANKKKRQISFNS